MKSSTRIDPDKNASIRRAIRDVPDFPKKGIIFKDITPVLGDPKLFRATVDIFAHRHAKSNLDAIVAIDARGFLFGAALAYELGLGIVPVRKTGKLPYSVIEHSYDLEYGSNTIAIHTDALEKGQRVLIVDDLLATGGTAQAAAHLVEKLGAKVAELDFVVELGFLKGREKLKGWSIFAPIVY